jgi:hypothetical protein
MISHIDKSVHRWILSINDFNLSTANFATWTFILSLIINILLEVLQRKTFSNNINPLPLFFVSKTLGTCEH